MRIPINLATQPYESARRFYRQWTLVLAVLALATVGLIALGVSRWQDGSDVRARVNEVKAQMQRLDDEKALAEQVLSRQEHQPLRERSRFLNELIARKALSWTRLFSELEALMPPRVHVTSIKPQVTKDQQLGIEIAVAGESRERVLELVRRMEQSTTFRHAEVRSESSTPDGLVFEVAAIYVAPAEAPAPAGGSSD